MCVKWCSEFINESHVYMRHAAFCWSYWHPANTETITKSFSLDMRYRDTSLEIPDEPYKQNWPYAERDGHSVTLPSYRYSWLHCATLTITLTFWTKNTHSGYPCPGNTNTNNISIFLDHFVFKLGANTRQTGGQTNKWLGKICNVVW